MRADLIFIIGGYDASFPAQNHSQYTEVVAEASRLKIFSDETSLTSFLAKPEAFGISTI